MKSADSEQLVARYRAWETEDLIRAVKFDSHGYTPEALALIVEELATRNDSVGERHGLEVAAAEKHDHEVRQYTGIRGWLLLLVLVVANLSITALLESVRSIRLPPLELQVFAFAKGIKGILGLMTFVLLLTTHRRAPGFAVNLFLFCMAIGLAEAFYGYYRGWKIYYPLAAVASGGFGWLICPYPDG